MVSKEDGSRTLLVDTGVYTRNRAFRILGSSKLGKPTSLDKLWHRQEFWRGRLQRVQQELQLQSSAATGTEGGEVPQAGGGTAAAARAAAASLDAAQRSPASPPFVAGAAEDASNCDVARPDVGADAARPQSAGACCRQVPRCNNALSNGNSPPPANPPASEPSRHAAPETISPAENVAAIGADCRGLNRTPCIVGADMDAYKSFAKADRSGHEEVDYESPVAAAAPFSAVDQPESGTNRDLLQVVTTSPQLQNSGKAALEASKPPVLAHAAMISDNEPPIDVFKKTLVVALPEVVAAGIQRLTMYEEDAEAKQHLPNPRYGDVGATGRHT